MECGLTDEEVTRPLFSIPAGGTTAVSLSTWASGSERCRDTHAYDRVSA